MPLTASWQDMKDFVRRANSRVRYADVTNRDLGEGICGFDTKTEAKEVAAELDGEPTLEDAVMELCQRHGEAWPHGLGSTMAERYGVSRQAVASRKKRALALIAEAG